MITGKGIKLLEVRHDLQILIKDLEKTRLKDEPCNINKLNDLYDLYYRVTQEIKIELGDEFIE